MRIVPPSKRKGISPVLATVILIAITLIAAIAVAGFVFGLFGTFTSTARVSASVTNCSGTPEVCTIILTNTGNANLANPTVCSLTFGGSATTGTFAVASGNLNSGSSAQGTCTDNTATAHAASGTQVTGSVILANGGNALFSATAS